MIKTTTFAYGLLLVLAFVVGLCGTLAASRAVLRMGVATPRVVEQPVSAPAVHRAVVAPRPISC